MTPSVHHLERQWCHKRNKFRRLCIITPGTYAADYLPQISSKPAATRTMSVHNLSIPTTRTEELEAGKHIPISGECLPSL
jgi:hypothetical protein